MIYVLLAGAILAAVWGGVEYIRESNRAHHSTTED